MSVKTRQWRVFCRIEHSPYTPSPTHDPACTSFARVVISAAYSSVASGRSIDESREHSRLRTAQESATSRGSDAAALGWCSSSGARQGNCSKAGGKLQSPSFPVLLLPSPCLLCFLPVRILFEALSIHTDGR